MKRSWESRRAGMLARWTARSQRERRLLQSMMALLLLLTFWYGIWQPWSTWRGQLRLQLSAMQTQALALHKIEVETRHLRRKTVAPAPDARRMEVELRRRGARLQVEWSACRVPTTATLECDGEAAFDQWLLLLASLQQAPVLPLSRWRAEATGMPGRVRLAIRLGEAGA